MTDDQEQKLLDRVRQIEQFQAEAGRRLILVRGEAMASTQCLVEAANCLSRGGTVDGHFVGTVLMNADAVLFRQRVSTDLRTQAAIDHARVLIKGMQMTLRSKPLPPIEALAYVARRGLPIPS